MDTQEMRPETLKSIWSEAECSGRNPDQFC